MNSAFRKPETTIKLNQYPVKRTSVWIIAIKQMNYTSGGGEKVLSATE